MWEWCIGNNTSGIRFEEVLARIDQPDVVKVQRRRLRVLAVLELERLPWSYESVRERGFLRKYSHLETDRYLDGRGSDAEIAGNAERDLLPGRRHRDRVLPKVRYSCK